MSQSDFNTWFAAYLGESPNDVDVLLRDETAVRFLIAWSLFEKHCFLYHAKEKDIGKYCRRIVNDEGFNSSSLDPILEHFHARYQNKSRFDRLMYGRQHPDIKPLLARPVTSLLDIEKTFFLVAVVYRYRNNIFHGMKGVWSWLTYKPQIERCIKVMQVLITHAKRSQAKDEHVESNTA